MDFSIVEVMDDREGMTKCVSGVKSKRSRSAIHFISHVLLKWLEKKQRGEHFVLRFPDK